MNTHIRPTFRRINDSIPVPITHAPLPPLPDDYWERRAHHAEERLQTANDAIRCACDWLRMQAPGRALEVLENNLTPTQGSRCDYANEAASKVSAPLRSGV